MARTPTGPSTYTIEVDTRDGIHVDNEQVPVLTASYQTTFAALSAKFPDSPLATEYRTRPSGFYNCHGLVFAARRTRIDSSTEVAKIIAQDGYDLIPRDKVLPGDVVLYVTPTGDIEHSGVVVERPKPPLMHARVLSKWGLWREVLHWEYACPYDKTEVRFYRVTK